MTHNIYVKLEYNLGCTITFCQAAVIFQAHRLVPVSLLGEQRHNGYEQFA